MSQRGVLYQWTVVVAKRFETLTLPQAKALAAFGLGLAQRCALSAVAGKLYSVGNVGNGGAPAAALHRQFEPGVGRLLSDVVPMGARQPEGQGVVGAAGG